MAVGRFEDMVRASEETERAVARADKSARKRHQESLAAQAANAEAIKRAQYEAANAADRNSAALADVARAQREAAETVVALEMHRRAEAQTEQEWDLRKRALRVDMKAGYAESGMEWDDDVFELFWVNHRRELEEQARREAREAAEQAERGRWQVELAKVERELETLPGEVAALQAQAAEAEASRDSLRARAEGTINRMGLWLLPVTLGVGWFCTGLDRGLMFYVVAAVIGVLSVSVPLIVRLCRPGAQRGDRGVLEWLSALGHGATGALAVSGVMGVFGIVSDWSFKSMVFAGVQTLLAGGLLFLGCLPTSLRQEADKAVEDAKSLARRASGESARLERLRRDQAALRSRLGLSKAKKAKTVPAPTA